MSCFFLFQIRVNSILPAIVFIEFGKMAWSDPAKSGPMLARIPLGRFAGNFFRYPKVQFMFTSALMVNLR